jgi:arylsulfatase A-like enzyme
MGHVHNRTRSKRGTKLVASGSRLRDADHNIVAVLAELDAAGLTDKTIIVLTADHGDMDGTHQLHAKGAVAYR